MPTLQRAPAEPAPAADAPEDFASFQGTLAEIGLPSLLSILEMERKTGILLLTVEPERERAHLHLRVGRVVRAHMEHRDEPSNAELVYCLLARTSGTFDFHPSDVALGDELQCSTAGLIIEGARRIDEMRPVPDPAPTGRTIADAGRAARKERVPLRRPLSRKKRRRFVAPPVPTRRLTLARAAIAALSMSVFALAVLTTMTRPERRGAEPTSPSVQKTSGLRP